MMQSKYLKFKIGDIVKDSKDGIWGDTQLRITHLHGNDYCPSVSVEITAEVGKIRSSKSKVGLKMNLLVKEIRLIGSEKRPLVGTSKGKLLKLVSRGNMEARRELSIRLNNKTL